MYKCLITVIVVKTLSGEGIKNLVGIVMNNKFDSLKKITIVLSRIHIF